MAQGEGVGRGQLVGAAVDTTGIGHVAQGKVFFDGQGVQGAGKVRVGGDDLELGAKHKSAVVQQRIKHGLDAQAVTRKKQGLLVAVPQGEGEHAAKALHAGLAPRLPGVQDDLGVAAGAEGVAQGFEFGHQFLVVVDFAVEDDDDRVVFVEQGLLAGGDVNDRQTAVAEGDTGLLVQARFIGPPVRLDVVDAGNQRRVEVALAAGVKESGDATHGYLEERVCSSRVCSAGPLACMKAARVASPSPAWPLGA